MQEMQYRNKEITSLQGTLLTHENAIVGSLRENFANAELERDQLRANLTRAEEERKSALHEYEEKEAALQQALVREMDKNRECSQLEAAKSESSKEEIGAFSDCGSVPGEQEEFVKISVNTTSTGVLENVVFRVACQGNQCS